MAWLWNEPPIEPFRQPQEDAPCPKQTGYTISTEDQGRLAPYLPPKRDTFLTEAYRNDPAASSIEEDEQASQNNAASKACLRNPRDNKNPTNLPHSTNQVKLTPECLPHVTLTYAQSLDSQLSLAPGQRTTLSGLQTKAMTHYLRANHDAILIGVGTANVDNPGLNCSFSYDGGKIVELAEQPRPLILDPGRSWKEEKCEKLFSLARAGLGRAPWWIVCEDSVGKWKVKERDEERVKKIKDIGGDVIAVGKYANREDGVEWEKILRALWNTGIRSVMIEGGATVINDLLRERNQHLVSSVIVTIAPTYLGTGGVVVAPPRSKADENEARLREVTWIPFGQDVVMAGQLACKRKTVPVEPVTVHSAGGGIIVHGGFTTEA